MLHCAKGLHQHYANGTKTITFFCDWRYNLQSHNSQNQKSIANEKHQSNQTAAWQALQKHFDEMKDVTMPIFLLKTAIVFLSSPQPSTTDAGGLLQKPHH